MSAELLGTLNKWLFVAALVFFIKGGLMWLITFMLSFVACYEGIRRYVRHITEKDMPSDFPRLPFPIWMHFIFGWLALVVAVIVAELVTWN